MMTFNISVLGTVTLCALAIVSVGLLAYIDRRMLERFERVAVVGLVQMLLLFLTVWGLYAFYRWWILLLWLLLLAVVSSVIALNRLHSRDHWLLLFLTAAFIIGTLVPCSLLYWSLSPTGLLADHRLLIPIFALTVAHLQTSLGKAMQTFYESLRHTTAHRQYLLSAGATQLESLMPSIQRTLLTAMLPVMRTLTSPAVLSMPLLFAGLLLGGLNVLAASCVTLLFYVSCITASVIALFVTIALWHYIKKT